jgi:predicted nucleic acid-binding protein
LIVVDASVVVELVLRTAGSEILWDRILPDRSWHAPHLVDVEVTQVVRRWERRREIQPDQARAALGRLDELPLRRYPHRALIPRMWELRRNLTAYDASYVALAEILDVPLVTRDVRLATAPGHVAAIELL